VNQTGLLTDLAFVWNGIASDETSANTGYLGFDSFGDLIAGCLGIDHPAGTCGVSAFTNQWYVAWYADNSSEAQGRRREALSEGSVEQSRDPTNSNRIEALLVGRAGPDPRSPQFPSTGQRQEKQLRLAFETAGEHGSSAAAREGAEPDVAKRETESPAITKSLMEEVCERENLKEALRRVKANHGSPGGGGGAGVYHRRRALRRGPRHREILRPSEPRFPDGSGGQARNGHTGAEAYPGVLERRSLGGRLGQCDRGRHAARGTPSPLLSNIVLHELDCELERRGHRFARYADDCNVYVRSARAGHRVMETVTAFIAKRLKLKVNTAKSAVARAWTRTFLGFSFTHGQSPKRRLSAEALSRFQARVRELRSQ